MSRQHGTKACYVFGPDGGRDTSKGCRCGACAQANRDEKNTRSRLKAYGRWQPLVDAGPVREHLELLSAAGLGWKQAAKLAGVSNGAVSKILYGMPGRPPSRRVRPETAAAVLSVRLSLDLLADSAMTDAAGTRRRVQALAAAGWSQGRVAARLGVSRAALCSVMRRGRVTAVTARAVRDLYLELWDQPPPEGTPRERDAARRARGHAASRGWVPALAWDDIDDPQAVPVDGWQRAGELPSAELAAEARDLERLGVARGELAARLGVSAGRVEYALKAYPRAGEAA